MIWPSTVELGPQPHWQPPPDSEVLTGRLGKELTGMTRLQWYL
jgi:hypothetical protein